MGIVQWSVESGRGHFVVGTEPFELGTEAVRAVYILAKQVGQLAPGYWTAPFIAASSLIFAYAHLQISFSLDDYLVMYSLVLCFFFTFFFFVVVSSATKRSQHKYRKFFFNIASHIVPLFVSWSEVG